MRRWRTGCGFGCRKKVCCNRRDPLRRGYARGEFLYWFLKGIVVLGCLDGFETGGRKGDGCEGSEWIWLVVDWSSCIRHGPWRWC